MLPRGIRNCNPLNIRRTAKDQWKGLAERQQDAAFCQFKSLEYGWRAAFYLLTRTYYHKYRLYTIRTIIRRWAPFGPTRPLDDARCRHGHPGERHPIS